MIDNRHNFESKINKIKKKKMIKFLKTQVFANQMCNTKNNKKKTKTKMNINIFLSSTQTFIIEYKKGGIFKC